MGRSGFVVHSARLFAVLASLLCLGLDAPAQKERYYPFNGADGAYPFGGLVADAIGNLYGASLNGGSANLGVIYELSPAAGGAVESVLYNFAGSSMNADGAYPLGDLIFDAAGNLYGTTSAGGASNNGTIFELSPPSQPGGIWMETVLYNFTGGVDGAEPKAGLVMAPGGSLYGTTSAGGDSGQGTAFQFDTDLNLTVLHSFGGYPSDGSQPVAPLIFDTEGNLYGTTNAGGTYDGGTVFELSLSTKGTWAETIFHAFGIEGDGVNPQSGLTIGQSGVLVGTTIGGGTGGQACGTVFALGPPPVQQYKILFSFNLLSDGCNVLGNLIEGPGGVLYGTTQFGGPSPGMGTVFELVDSDPGTWTENILFTFNGEGGEIPSAGVIINGKSLYGTTVHGGRGESCGQGCGGVFRLSR